LLASGIVRKQDVLAYLNDRNENEIIVLPAHIADLTIQDLTSESSPFNDFAKAA
jgi:hypothetical protein